MELAPRPTPTPAPTPAPSPLPARGRARHALRVVLALALAAAGLGGALWSAAQTDHVRARLRARIAEGLDARLPGARLTGEARVSPAFRVVFGPVVLPAGSRGRSLLTIREVTVRPRLAALLAGRVEAAAVRLDGVAIDGGLRGAGLRDLARLGAEPPARPRDDEAAAPAPVVAFRDLRIRLALVRGARAVPLEVGPLSGKVRWSREAGERRAVAALRLPGGGDGRLEARWGAGSSALAVRLRDVTAEALPAALRARLPVAVRRGALDLALDAPHLAATGPLSATFSAAARELELEAARLAPAPVGPMSARAAGTVRWDGAARTLTAAGARLELGAGGAPLSLDASLRLRPEPAIALSLRAAEVDWAALVAALPAALRPPAEAPPVAGAFSGSISIEGPLRRPTAWRVDGAVDLRGLAPARGAAALEHPFVFRAPLPGGGEREVVVGPRNPAFVPLAELPAWVWRAVVTSEDAGFFLHHGFDLHELQDALARAGGRRLRGASTISQQLAKNLYLGPDRTLARKVREALATAALESSLGKRRILEIYLNVVEWGPGGARGLGEAARHFFGKDARQLSPKEAAFLATILPNPVRYDLYRRRGGLTERWEDRVRSLLVKLRATDAIDDRQLSEAWYAPLAFTSGGGRR